ncbi:TetR/AcrR family transcriptional regulator [Aliikangiella marina]|uniref:TetR/AcrR family transcriptional regulator n=1 Tax=Aliikangiella marina TaxID=1712262 RepID=UPI00163DE03D|nr:TetR/AcrR family transcriptional regulator [Aliikangiella marina]
MNKSDSVAAAKQQRDHYHHGDLRESLISAATQLVREKGPDKFSMADACKLAGVSKAAPYRHFANKEDLLKSVIAVGFEEMRQDMLAASNGLVSGSNQRITAIGLTYIAFAIKEPAIFKLMFGNSMNIKEPDSEMIGKPTFQILLDEIIARTQLHDVDKLMAIAFPLWTLVHGASMLTIDDSYKRIYPGSNTDQMIIDSTELLLSSFPEPV